MIRNLTTRTLITRRAVMFGLPATAAALALPQFANAMSPKVYTEDGIAVDGSDVVAYFTDSKPVAGDPAITYDWMGSTWRFASTANRDAFIKDPEAYAPQYGGYCAYAMSEGYVATTVPEAWTIVDGKLYLNYSVGVRGLWSQDIPGRIKAADANWPDALNK